MSLNNGGLPTVGIFVSCFIRHRPTADCTFASPFIPKTFKRVLQPIDLALSDFH